MKIIFVSVTHGFSTGRCDLGKNLYLRFRLHMHFYTGCFNFREHLFSQEPTFR